METQGNIGMNYVTRDIMNRFNISSLIALEVQAVLDRSDIDFSECTSREYERALDEAFKIYHEENETY